MPMAAARAVWLAVGTAVLCPSASSFSLSLLDKYPAPVLLQFAKNCSQTEHIPPLVTPQGSSRRLPIRCSQCRLPSKNVWCRSFHEVVVCRGFCRDGLSALPACPRSTGPFHTNLRTLDHDGSATSASAVQDLVTPAKSLEVVCLVPAPM